MTELADQAGRRQQVRKMTPFRLSYLALIATKCINVNTASGGFVNVPIIIQSPSGKESKSTLYAGVFRE